MDIYLKYANGTVSGPHSEIWLTNRMSSGGVSPGDSVARVESGTEPRPEDYRPASAPNKSRPLADTVPSPGASGSRTGEFLRALGWMVGVSGCLSALVMLMSDQFGLAVFSFGLLLSTVYGALVWAAGAALGLLEQIRLAVARP